MGNNDGLEIIMEHVRERLGDKIGQFRLPPPVFVSNTTEQHPVFGTMLRPTRSISWAKTPACPTPTRTKGFGKQALIALDEKLIELGAESVGLHVFGHNTHAFELYKKMGYEVTNIQMRKVYKPE